MSGIDNLYREAKKLNKDITKKFVTDWLHTKNVYTLHKPVRHRFPRNKVIAIGLHYDWQIDLVDLQNLKKHNNGYVYLLTCIDIFGHYAWAVPLKSKRPSEVVRALKHIFKTSGLRPARIFSDNGGEFLNKTVAEFLGKNLVTHIATKNPETKCEMIENFHRSLRAVMWRHFTQKKTRRYLKVLPRIMKSLNARYNRSIKMAPKDVTLENEDLVRENLYGSRPRGAADAAEPKFRYNLGDPVRLSLQKSVFKRGYTPNFTNEIFYIVKRIPSKPTRTYEVEDGNGERIRGKFYEPELTLFKEGGARKSI